MVHTLGGNPDFDRFRSRYFCSPSPSSFHFNHSTLIPFLCAELPFTFSLGVPSCFLEGRRLGADCSERLSSVNPKAKIEREFPLLIASLTPLWKADKQTPCIISDWWSHETKKLLQDLCRRDFKALAWQMFALFTWFCQRWLNSFFVEIFWILWW